MFVIGTKSTNRQNFRGNIKNSLVTRKTNDTSMMGNEDKIMYSAKNNANMEKTVPKRLVRSKYTENTPTPTYARPTIATATRDIITARQLKLKTDKKPTTAITQGFPTVRKTAGQNSLAETVNPTKKTEPKLRTATTKISPRLYKSPNFELDLTTELKKYSSVETGIQSNEMEILNHELIVGDVKLLLPSPDLVALIEKDRKEQRRIDLVNSARKYDADNTAHLDDLKEFMESSAITRRSNKPIPPPKPIKSLKHKTHVLEKQILSQVTKEKSTTSLKTRIKQKEAELLSLFDNVDKFC